MATFLSSLYPNKNSEHHIKVAPIYSINKSRFATLIILSASLMLILIYITFYILSAKRMTHSALLTQGYGIK